MSCIKLNLNSRSSCCELSVRNIQIYTSKAYVTGNFSRRHFFFLHAVRSVFWQRHIGSPPPRLRAFNQLKEVITIRTEFNLGPDRHVAVTLLCYFVKKEISCYPSYYRKQNENTHFSNEMKLELVSLYYLSRFDSALCNVLHVLCEKLNFP